MKNQFTFKGKVIFVSEPRSGQGYNGDWRAVDITLAEIEDGEVVKDGNRILAHCFDAVCDKALELKNIKSEDWPKVCEAALEFSIRQKSTRDGGTFATQEVYCTDLNWDLVTLGNSTNVQPEN